MRMRSSRPSRRPGSARGHARSARGAFAARAGSGGVPPRGEDAAHGVHDALDRGHVRILDLPVRIRHVVARHAHDRPTQIEDRLLREHGSDLRREPAHARRLLDDDDPARPRDRREQPVLVERLERPQVEHLARGLALEAAAAASATCTIAPYATIVRSEPSRAIRACRAERRARRPAPPPSPCGSGAWARARRPDPDRESPPRADPSRPPAWTGSRPSRPACGRSTSRASRRGARARAPRRRKASGS